jgi:D-alanine-D-alanine ligase
MEIGLAFDLKSDFEPGHGPDDLLEEYDSPATVEAVECVLRARGHVVRRLGGGRNFLIAALEAPPELVFNFAEGRGSRSREGHVPAACEMLGIAYTHSDPLTMAVALDKAVAKRLVASAGVATPPFAVVEQLGDLDRLSLSYPLFAKPLCEGSSIGIRQGAKLASPAALRERVASLLAGYREPVLVEEYCPGVEFTVALLGTASTARVAGTMEIASKEVLAEDFVYSLERKRSLSWAQEIEYVVPPRRSAPEIAAVEAVALGAYRALGCRDVARVDVRVGRDGSPMFIEANPLPGIAPGWSDLALLWERLGKSYDDLVASILGEACARLGLR